MNDSFEEYLKSINATSDLMQEGLRFYLAERTNFLPFEEMRQEIIGGASNRSEVEEELGRLEQDPETLKAIARGLLSEAWEHPEERPKVKAALEGANTQLPVIDTGMRAIVAMYAMFLIATGGISRKTTETDETGKHKEEIVYAQPSDWFSGAAKVLNLWK